MARSSYRRNLHWNHGNTSIRRLPDEQRAAPISALGYSIRVLPEAERLERFDRVLHDVRNLPAQQGAPLAALAHSVYGLPELVRLARFASVFRATVKLPLAECAETLVEFGAHIYLALPEDSRAAVQAAMHTAI